MSFQSFMAKANRVVAAKTGMGVEDFADAPWRDLYDGMGDDVRDEDIIECLSEHDDIFCAMVELGGVY
jgi:hypothetical protein